MKIYFGIDGGGTKTGFSLSDENGQILGSLEKTTIHLKQVAKSDIKKIIKEGLYELLDSNNLKLEDISFTFAGIPGYGEYPEVIETMNRLMEELLKSKKFSLGNDSVCGWSGSLAGKAGVNLVLGTGAITYGMDYKGNSARSSGWGPYCGDEGSAYWLGRQAIMLFAKESDGRLNRGPLYEIIRKEFSLEEDFDLINMVIGLDDNRTEIAKFSRLLSRAALEGDQNCIAIIKEAAYEAALAIKACYEKLDFENEDEIFVSFSGGVFNIGSILTDEIKRSLSFDKRLKFVPSILEPKEGSILMAMREDGLEITDEIIENLRG